MKTTNIGLDYCTLWFEYIGDIYIGGCCKAHDAAYEQGITRLEADWQLYSCVRDLDAPMAAAAMFAATAAFGWYFYRKRK